MAERNKVVVIFVTAPEAEAAAEIARYLLGKRLVACVNIVPSIRSLYWWRGQLEESDEVLMVLKARREDVAAIAEQIRELHAYAVPEVVAAEVVGGLEAYLEWIVAETERGR
jgi:periplasmic divalent cation tolerance protein